MKEIYVIISGAYSDWEILGFCETEEEAIKSCIKYNRGLDGDNRWNIAYYQKANKFDVGTLELIKPNYVHEVRMYHYPDGWRHCKADGVEVWHDALARDKESYSTEVWTLAPFDRSAIFTICLKEIDRNRALKIAEDRLYQYLAEEEGL